MIKHIIPFFVLLASLTFASCAVEELKLATDAPEPPSRIVRTKSAPVALSRQDSLRLLYEYQRREDLFVLNHITGNKGSFSLNLSRSDAISLGISPELYDFYSSFVEQLNK